MKICRNNVNFQCGMVMCAIAFIFSDQFAMGIGVEPPPPLENASGQDPFEMSLDQLAELKVVVDVASLFDESELVVGSTVELITRDNWRRRGARTLGDAIGHLPSTILLPDVLGAQKLTIRGFAGRLIGGTATNLDGVPINGLDTGNALFEINGLQPGVLDQIQMVRGPGSAIYGPDAFHGILSLHTFESDTDVIEIESQVDTDGFRQGAFRLSRGVTEGTRVNSAVAYSKMPDQDETYTYTIPGTMMESTGERKNAFESFMGVFKFETDREEPVSVRAGAYVNKQSSDDFSGLGRFGSGGMSIRRGSDVSGTDSTFAMVNAAVLVKLPEEITLEVNGFFWDTDRHRFFNAVPGVVVNVDNDAWRAGTNVILRQPDNSLNTQWLVGYGFDKTRVNRHTVNGATAAQDGLDRYVNSLFAQAKTSFADDTIHLVYGGRFDDFSDVGSHFSPRAGVIVQPTPDSAIKFLYGNAFRPPTAAEIGGTGAAPGNPNLDPETIDTFEIVLMKHGSNWKATVTGFYSEWDDAIIAGTNSGKNEAHGFEASFQIIEENCRFDFSGSYAQSEDKTTGFDYVAFPEYIFNVGVGVTVPESDIEIYVVNRVHLNADEGPIIAAIPNPSDLKDYWRTDVTVTWRNPQNNSEVFVYFLNIFDRDNFLPSINNAEGGIPEAGFTAGIGFRCVN